MHRSDMVNLSCIHKLNGVLNVGTNVKWMLRTSMLSLQNVCYAFWERYGVFSINQWITVQTSVTIFYILNHLWKYILKNFNWTNLLVLFTFFFKLLSEMFVVVSNSKLNFEASVVQWSWLQSSYEACVQLASQCVPNFYEWIKYINISNSYGRRWLFIELWILWL